MIKNTIILFLVFAALIAGIAGWRGINSQRPPLELFSDMKRQMKIAPQSYTVLPSGEIPDKLENTIAFNDSDVSYEIINGLIKGTTNYVETIPVNIDLKLLQRGRDRYNIFCSSCHGVLGDAMTVSRRIGAMPIVANLHDLRIVKMKDGEIFNVITHGKNLMGAHGGMIPVSDRWAIIAYVRALQISRYGSIEDLTDEQKDLIKRIEDR